MSYLDSREQAGTMYVVGTLQARIEGKTYDLKAYSYRNDWNEIEALLLLLRDRTSGETTYGGGRVVDIISRRDRHHRRSRSTSTLRTASCARTPSTSIARWYWPTIWPWS